jgi:DNA-binding MarR family transcriptional regulator
MQNTNNFKITFEKWIGIIMRRSIHNIIRFARENGLSMSQIGALFYLHRKGSTGVTDLGDHLDVTSAAASQLTDRLVQLELIQRSEDPNDRRLKKIVLTDRGRQIINDGIHAQTNWIDEINENLNPNEREKIISALNIMIEKTRPIKM